MQYFVGLDWAAHEHAVCVIDERGKVVAQFMVEHTAVGMTELFARLSKFAPPAELRLAIERPTGVIVDTLVESGLAVVPIHPNAVKSSRPRYSAAQGKTDLGDAYLLADLLRTDGHRFRVLTPLSDQTKALRSQVRVRGDLVHQRVALANQLRCLLEQFWPGAAEVFPDIDVPIALDFLDEYPTPQSAAGLGEKRMAGFLARNSYRGRRPPREFVERLRSAVASVCGQLEAETKGASVRAFVAVLRPLVEQIAKLTAAIEQAVEAHPDAKVITPLFRQGRVCAAQILAELGDDRARFASAEQLAAEGGMTPITRASGKRHTVSFRWACNMRLRTAFALLADTTRRTTPWARAVYQRAREHGHEHAHALRVLGRAWCRVIWTCWQKHMAYDPTKHRAALPFAATPVNFVEQEAA
jgi:transposase